MHSVLPSHRRIMPPSRAHSPQAHPPTPDSMTRSTSSTLTLDDPHAALLDRWQSLARRLRQPQLSLSAIVALNRTLDQAERVVGAALGAVDLPRDGKNIGLGISEHKEQRQAPRTVAEATPPPSAVGSPPNNVIEAVPQRESTEHETLLKGVTDAASALRRQYDQFKVRGFESTRI